MSRRGRVAVIDSEFARIERLQGKGPLPHERPLASPPPMVELPDDIREVLRDEREYVGFYVSGHPLDHVDPRLFAGADKAASVGDGKAGRWLTVVGLVLDQNIRQTKRGVDWARFSLEDASGTCLAFAFGEPATRIGEGFLLRVRGVVEIRDDAPQLKATEVTQLERW